MDIERLLWFLAAFGISAVATSLVILLAKRFGFVDHPAGRKVHTKAMPLLGGVAIYISVAICLLVVLQTSGTLTSGAITLAQYSGFLLGGFILMVGGAFDDRFELPARLSLVPPVLAALVAVASGMDVSKLTNPFGGVLLVAPWTSNVMVFIWLLIVMYTTKLLDGLDGLATGVASIGTLMILGLSLTVAYFQPDVALFSSIILGALFGFLLWNFHPAKIFLGEGGSTFIGFSLGTLAVISGGKLATALLAIGIPLIDVAWSILRRWRSGGFKKIFAADRQHLHHRLLDLGWSQRRIVLSYYAVAAAFGLAALFLQSRQKLFALAMLALAMLGLIIWLAHYERKQA